MTIFPDDVSWLRCWCELERLSHDLVLCIFVQQFVFLRFFLSEKVGILFFKSNKSCCWSSQIFPVLKDFLDLGFFFSDFVKLLIGNEASTCFQTLDQWAIVERESNVCNMAVWNIRWKLFSHFFHISTSMAFLSVYFGIKNMAWNVTWLGLFEMQCFVEVVFNSLLNMRFHWVSCWDTFMEISTWSFVVGIVPALEGFCINDLLYGVVTSSDCGHVPFKLADHTSLVKSSDWD